MKLMRHELYKERYSYCLGLSCIAGYRWVVDGTVDDENRVLVADIDRISMFIVHQDDFRLLTRQF